MRKINLTRRSMLPGKPPGFPGRSSIGTLGCGGIARPLSCIPG